ncbi:MAG: single-stranded-DNA-specific exonuclease RecJ [bacterium]|nr:single-stranded-DNA-specific exonuclease RecJ [bacterium]
MKWRLVENKKILILDVKDINPVVLRLLSRRGVTPDQVNNFLNPNYTERLHDPFLFKNMPAVVERIFKAIEQNEKITVYGDYDADGVTSTALLFKTLEFLQPGKNLISVYIPDRKSEGYGLNNEALKYLAENGTKLVITVDTGIRSVGEINFGKNLGTDIIVTDHHEAPDELPDCLIINPKVPGETYPFDGLAGCGVAFKLAQALLKKSQKKAAEVFEKWLLDLVAIGTIADLMPLLDENRVLVKYGLVVLNKTQRVGLKQLIKVSQSDTDKNGNSKEIDTWQVGFQLAPRINAMGRLDHANNAYQLLVTEDKAEAVKVAKELDGKNKERQEITLDIFEQADAEIKQEDKILFAVWPKLLSVSAKENGQALVRLQEKETDQTAPWSAGVMGLVAGKLTEKYYRPSLAITDKDGEATGSGRSIPEFDITAMLEECAEFLSTYGGHKQACGFTVKDKDSLLPFLKKCQKIAAKKLKNTELEPTLEIDLEVDFKNIDEDLYNALRKLRPFGMGNQQPKFITKKLLVAHMQTMGNDNQHLKLRLCSEDKKLFNAIAFSAPAEWLNLKIGQFIDLVYYLDINEWNGRREVQLKVIDLKYNANTTN